MRNHIFSSGMQMREGLADNVLSQRGPAPANAKNRCARRRRLGLVGRLAVWLALAAALLVGHSAARAQVIRRVSAPEKFFVDDKSSVGLLYNYAAYIISNNTAATIPSVYVAI